MFELNVFGAAGDFRDLFTNARYVPNEERQVYGIEGSRADSPGTHDSGGQRAVLLTTPPVP